MTVCNAFFSPARHSRTPLCLIHPLLYTLQPEWPPLVPPSWSQYELRLAYVSLFSAPILLSYADTSLGFSLPPPSSLFLSLFGTISSSYGQYLVYLPPPLSTQGKRPRRSRASLIDDPGIVASARLIHIVFPINRLPFTVRLREGRRLNSSVTSHTVPPGAGRCEQEQT
ncbi:hypothetical protein CPB86DRAFT_19734 [Serendipita vermifera]|nr:hypothetical protein CPB86DRAFT_19734 [Serendipita vermifera]